MNPVAHRAAPHLEVGPVCFPMTGDLFGGSVVSTLLLAAELVRRGRAVTIAVHGEGPVLDLVRERGLPHALLPSLGTALPGRGVDSLRPGNLTSLPACLRFLRRARVGLVHANENRTLRTWALPARLAGVPLVAHWRGNYRSSLSVDLGLRFARRVIAISEQNAAALPPWVRAKTSIVLNPFVTDAAPAGAPVTRAELGIPAEAALIGVFGNLVARKRPHRLAEILKRLLAAADGRPVWGLLCGGRMEPHDAKLDEALQDPDVAARIVQPGHVADPQAWMRLCDAVLMPAVDEPFGRVVIEAQAIGVPVILSTGCGVKEVVEHGVSALVLDPDDREAWVAATARVLDEPALAKRLVEGGRAVAARLSPGRHADAVEEVYRMAVLPPRHPRHAPRVLSQAPTAGEQP